MSKHLLLFILILAVCTNVFAQQTKSISGVVYDSNTGEALIGVSVLEVGTTNGTITDFDGKYTLKVSSNKVSFSYVGFKTEIVNNDTLKLLSLNNFIYYCYKWNVPHIIAENLAINSNISRQYVKDKFKEFSMVS